MFRKSLDSYFPDQPAQIVDDFRNIYMLKIHLLHVGIFLECSVQVLNHFDSFILFIFFSITVNIPRTIARQPYAPSS